MDTKDRTPEWSGISSRPGLTVWMFALASKIFDPYFMSCVNEGKWGDAAVSIAASVFGFILFWGISVVVLGAFEHRTKFRINKLEGAASAVVEFLVFVAAYYFIHELFLK